MWKFFIQLVTGKSEHDEERESRGELSERRSSLTNDGERGRVTGTQAGGVAELITRCCEAIFAIGLVIIRIAGSKGRGED